MLGGFVYGLYYLSQKPAPVEPTQAKSARKVINKNQQAAKKDEVKPVEVKNKRPRFEFYTILPEMEVVIPEEELVDNKSSANSSVKKVSKDKFVKNSLLLQAGSFKKYQDADRLKAKLALIGLEANIQNVNIGKDKWHRVRIGPFKALDDINETRVRLAENNIQTIIIKYQK